MAVSVLVEGLGEDFMKYMELFKPFLFLALRNTAAASVCASAIGVAGDICRNFQNKVLPYADELMQILLETLSVSVEKKVVSSYSNGIPESELFCSFISLCCETSRPACFSFKPCFITD
jgi:hypothetical protein